MSSFQKAHSFFLSFPPKQRQMMSSRFGEAVHDSELLARPRITWNARPSGCSSALIGLGAPSDGPVRHPNFNSFLMGRLRLAEKVQIKFSANRRRSREQARLKKNKQKNGRGEACFSRQAVLSVRVLGKCCKANTRWEGCCL